MADTDLLVVSRGGVEYKITRGELDAYLNEGYTVVDSMLFNGTDAYLSRTPTVTGNQKTWTWSGWVKRGSLGTYQVVTKGFTDASNYDRIIFFTDNTLRVNSYISGATSIELVTNALFRDPSSWYHIIVAIDTTQATESNRAKLFVNGEQVTSLSVATYPALNADTNYNDTNLHSIGAEAEYSGTQPFDGYQAEVNFVDGQALTTSAFGETGAFGEWLPKKYTGTYGTNGFYLEALDSADLGKDTSGNGNDWINNNVVQVIDTPTDNYATLNPLNSSSSSTLSNGNLDVISSTSAYNERTTIQLPLSGKWYFEATITQVDQFVGVLKGTVENNVLPSNTTDGWSFLCINGNKSNNVTQTAYASACSVGQTIGTAIDMDTGDLTFYRNGVSLGVAFTITDTSNLFFTIGQTTNASRQNVSNFGQTPFTYAPPTGFKALSTQNLPNTTVVPSESFNTITYSGDASTSRAITGVGFQPDLTWIKVRSGTYSHNVIDSVRGATKSIFTNTNDQEYTYPNGLKSFDPDGFSVGNLVDVNAINSTYVGWNWKAGTTVTNNDGTLEAEVSANPDAGFSVVKTQSGSSGTQTIGHGLEVVPEVIFMKTTDKAGEWSTWEGVSGNPATSYGYLNLNDAFNTDSQQWSTTGDVVPNSSVFNINTGYTFGAGSLGDPFVAYCFASKEGYSKIGAYTGNGSADGTFIYTGFRPAFVMVKGLDLNSNWYIYDATRGTTNVELPFLNPNNSDAEQYFGAYDFVSNGFKNRETNQYFNQSNEKYLYMAFAEQPFKNANAR